MSASAFLLGMFLTWTVIGVASAVVMGRRGYAPFSWLVLGAVFGPLVVPLAFARARQVRQLPVAADLGTRQGAVDVLVGVDGSNESVAAASVVAVLLADRVGRFTLATVVDYDSAIDGETNSAHSAARLELAHAADAVAELLPYDLDTAVLAGKPADALVVHAVDGRYDVIAVGSRGLGASKLVMGSVATHLSRGAPVPVLMINDNVASPSAG